MTESNALLTICIPTRNRAQLLTECLGSVLPEAEMNNIPVLVSDNGSTDTTADILCALEKRHRCLRIVTRDKNVGYDANALAVARQATTRYVWEIGDSQLLIPGSILRVLHLLCEQPDLLVADYYQNYRSYAKRVGMSHDHHSTCATNFLRDFAWHCTLIGSVIAPVGAWQWMGLDRYVGTDLVQIGAFFEHLSRLASPKIDVIAEPLLHANPTSLLIQRRSCWAEHPFQTFMLNWTRVIDALPKSYSEEDKAVAIKSHSVNTGLFSTRSLVFLRIKGLFSFRTLMCYGELFTRVSPVSVWMSRIIAILPRWVLRAGIAGARRFQNVRWKRVGARTF